MKINRCHESSQDTLLKYLGYILYKDKNTFFLTSNQWEIQKTSEGMAGGDHGRETVLFEVVYLHFLNVSPEKTI
jgi:hypothetical protein